MKNIPEMTVLSDREILHRTETRGVVVCRTMRCKLGDHTADVRFWYDLSSPELGVHHIDSIPVQVS